ncbi:hypothetical protein ABGV42_00635 [Paenibacillus pabuli]|uniref:hypothetical protein n=1 Tax=Paenibacillus pabuli TaxID=1472 RepID=UPI003242C7AD
MSDYALMQCSSCKRVGTVSKFNLQFSKECQACFKRDLIYVTENSTEIDFSYNHDLSVDNSDNPFDAFVNVYRVTRHYGGPEEGGWWYNNYRCVETVKSNLFLAKTVLEQLEEKYSEHAHGDIYSVNGGQEFVVAVEVLEAQGEDTSRPYYE